MLCLWLFDKKVAGCFFFTYLCILKLTELFGTSSEEPVASTVSLPVSTAVEGSSPLPIQPAEDEPEWDQNAVVLDWYNSDLNLVISKPDFLSAAPLQDGYFAHMWGGAKATYGFHGGKICYEVKVHSLQSSMATIVFNLHLRYCTFRLWKVLA